MNALILVDLQNDFMPGGALPVPDGNAVIPLANELLPAFELVVATQDWHPAGHGSFASNHPGRKPGDVIELNGLTQLLWPPHCVQYTTGAAFVKELDAGKITKVFQKGTDPGIDSYSGFFDNGHRKATGLGDYLKAKGVTAVSVLGVATDYCIKFTALDAVQLGFKTTLLASACRGVNVHSGDVDRAISDLRAAGVAIQ